MMRWGEYGWGMGFGWGLGWLFFVLLWVLAILGVVNLIRFMAGRGSRGSSAETPLDILKRRYAKGEISKEEFERMKEDIGKP
jgi:putative membrane protein